MARARIGRLAFAAAMLAALLFFVFEHRASAQTHAQAAVEPAGAGSSSTPTAATSGTHVVTVTFDYDFTKNPACSASVTKHCIQQFIAYDISAGADHATMLFPIPLPPNPVGAMKGITKASPPLEFESGKHLISVAAMSADGTHSRRSLCTTWITIP